MTDTQDVASSKYKKARRTKQTDAERQEAKEAEWRKARIQWYAIAAFLVLATIAVIVLLSVFTEGELPAYGQPNGS